MNINTNTITIWNFDGEMEFTGQTEVGEKFAKGDFIATETGRFADEGRFWVGYANGFVSVATWPTLQAALDYVNRER